MEISGHLRKMNTSYADIIQYELVLDDAVYPLNDKIGQYIEIEFLGNINCQACGKKTKTSFNQGFCYLCFDRLARNDRCVMNPHLCHFAKGTCREPEWGLAHCMQPHIVYVAWSSNLKVGITKPSQIPIRWMDQGASHAVAICEVTSRYHAGLIEEYLSQWYSDRTNWRKMLSGEEITVDLLEKAHEAQSRIKQGDFPQQLRDGLKLLDLDLHEIEYPLDLVGPIKSLSLDKQRVVSGYLLGIKGQYLLLDTGVINIRKHGSYEVRVCISDSS
jgi:hypothetical protein